MAKRNRRNRKEENNADETLVDIVEAGGQAKNFMEENQSKIFGVLVAFVVLIGGYMAYGEFYKKPRNVEAMSQMFKAEEYFRVDSFAKALSPQIDGYPGFLTVIENYSGTKAANLANYYAGVSYLHLGEYKAAISYLEDFSANDKITPSTKNGAIGDAHSELGDMGQALKYYKKAASYENDLLAPYYLLKAGLLSEKQGNADEARKMYTKIKDNYPKSIQSQEADQYLARVGK